MVGILNRLDAVVSSAPDTSIALSSARQALTYGATVMAVEKLVAWFQAIESEVVALQASNCIEWVLVDFACQELGLIFIPLPAFFTVDQVQKCVISAGVDTFLSDQHTLPSTLNLSFSAITSEVRQKPFSFSVWQRVSRSSQNMPKGTQKITFTSGSTGEPKGVCLSVEHQLCVAQSLADAINIKQPKHLCLLPLSTLLENIAGVYTPLLSGGTVHIPSDDDRGVKGSSMLSPKVLLNYIGEIQPMTMILVPQLLAMLVQACVKGWKPPSSLSFVAVGGGKVSPQLISKARSLGLPIFQGYGLSECGSVVTLNTATYDRVDSVGCALAHSEIEIENDEVVIYGKAHLGYLGDEASWYPKKINTGDMGSLENGFLKIDGRSKNMLISSFGRNISPEWVESVLMSEATLSHCVVFGESQPFLALAIVAPIAVTDDDVLQWLQACNKSLPDYAQIGSWMRLTDQEMAPFLTANGRPQRKKILSEFSDLIDKLYLEKNISLCPS